jgi:hypothetical protein
MIGPLKNAWNVLRVQGRYKIYNNFIILAYSKGSDIVSNSIMRNKYWELYDTERIMKQLDFINSTIGNKTLVFIDVGANIGWFTLAAASKGY